MITNKQFDKVLDQCSREVGVMAVWRSLGIIDKEKALRLLLGRDWKYLYKATIEKYENSIGR